MNSKRVSIAQRVQIIGSHLSPYIRKVLVVLDLKRIPYEIDPIVPFYVNDCFSQIGRDAYRLMYVVNLKRAVYVLHAFMKKSKSRIGIPKPDVELMKVRLKRAQAIDAED